MTTKDKTKNVNIDKGKDGRPTLYSAELGLEICVRLAEGESIRSICRDDSMPCRTTVFNWLLDPKRKEFLNQYESAREMQAETLADEITDIADNSTNDYMFRMGGDDNKEVANPENIQRSRLRIDARKWIASKLKPKKYGDKIQQELTGADGGAIEITGIDVVFRGKDGK